MAPWLFPSLLFAAAAPEVACPADPAGVERAQRLQADADVELEAGNGPRAAELLGEVADAYPECRAYHGRRMMALERALEQHRVAFAADGERDHLVAALARIDRYLMSLHAAHGANAEQTQGHARLTAVRGELLAILPSARESPPPVVTPSDPEAVGPRRDEMASEPKRPTGRGLLIGGGLAVGGGAIFLVMAIAGADRWARLERRLEDHALAERVAIAGVIGSTVLIATGAALLGVGGYRRAARMRLGAALHPRFIGLSLQGHF